MSRRAFVAYPHNLQALQAHFKRACQAFPHRDYEYRRSIGNAIAPTRLLLQDVESGAIILLDISAEDAKNGELPLEPVRIFSADTATQREGATGAAGPAEAVKPGVPRKTPVPVILTRYTAQDLYAPLRTVEPASGVGCVSRRRDLCCPRCRSGAGHWLRGGWKTSG